MLLESAAEWRMILATAILGLCLFLLLVHGRRKHRETLKKYSFVATGYSTQELSVQENLWSLRTLEEIVFCESEEIIS